MCGRAEPADISLRIRFTCRRCGSWRTPSDIRDNHYALSPAISLNVTTAQSIDLPCPHCHANMRLVRHLDLKEMPEIYVFYCSRCQHGETMTQERAA